MLAHHLSRGLDRFKHHNLTPQGICFRPIDIKRINVIPKIALN